MRHLAVLNLFILLIAADVMNAQPAASSLTGRVTSNGEGLPGVTITVSSPSLLADRTTVTAANGGYFFRNLPAAIYDVHFEIAGGQTVIRRVEVRLAETSRLDTERAMTGVEETITSTTLMPTLLETSQLSMNVEAATVDRLPLGRSVRERLVLAPGLEPRGELSLVDGLALSETVEEAIDETTIITAGVPAEYASIRGEVIATTTRLASNDFSASARATFASRDRRLFELAAGGAVFADRLWYFAAGSEGETLFSDGRTRSVARLDGALGDHHRMSVSHFSGIADDRDHVWSGRYDGALRSSTLDALASDRQWSANAHAFFASPRAGSHSIVVGTEDPGDRHSGAMYINDTWRAAPRWSFNLGIRHSSDSEHSSAPRIGGVFDARGDGEHRISASWARYSSTERSPAMDEATAAYGWRFGVGGYARADFVRRTAETVVDYVQVHAVYDVFRIFRFGGNYAGRVSGESELRHRTNVWMWFEPAVGEGTLTLALLQRHLAGQIESFTSTDLSSMYAFPAANLTAFAKVDLLNAFDDTDVDVDPAELALPRTWRAAIGVRY